VRKEAEEARALHLRRRNAAHPDGAFSDDQSKVILLQLQAGKIVTRVLNTETGEEVQFMPTPLLRFILWPFLAGK
jgi:hypothetical protein